MDDSTRRSVWCDGASHRPKQDDLRDFASRFGTVETVRLDRDDTNREQIVVRFTSVKGAVEFCERANDRMLFGNRLLLTMCTNKALGRRPDSRSGGGPAAASSRGWQTGDDRRERDTGGRTNRQHSDGRPPEGGGAARSLPYDRHNRSVMNDSRDRDRPHQVPLPPPPLPPPRYNRDDVDRGDRDRGLSAYRGGYPVSGGNRPPPFRKDSRPNIHRPPRPPMDYTRGRGPSSGHNTSQSSDGDGRRREGSNGGPLPIASRRSPPQEARPKFASRPGGHKPRNLVEGQYARARDGAEGFLIRERSPLL
eukprot:m.153948 g.153948  ORF g.153948 m.153948 type:complete len:307 (+) comp23480_c0_seq1:357-1277(+)